jgi:hypothetical protein
MTQGLKSITIVEIDMDYCNLTYGVGACGAVLGTTGERKCFNTAKTCQDRENIDLGTLTLRFSYNQDGLPPGQTIFPCLASVSSRPVDVNLSGIDPKSTAMGKSARVTVKFLDFPYHDTYVDKYRGERVSGSAQTGPGYLPEAQGTFFSKLGARWPYYQGRALRVRRGYVGQALVDMDTAHYVITGWDGPNVAGEVTVAAKDRFDFAENTKALAPPPSQGKLLEPISATGTTARLSPEGIGDDEYPASGYVTIGREVAQFTRSGDALTFTKRGVLGSTASAHGDGDLVQVSLYYFKQRPYLIVADLAAYAGIDPSYIPLAEWEENDNKWLGGTKLTGFVAKPTGVKDLLGEIGQLGILIFQDPITQEFKFEPTKPRFQYESPVALTDDNRFVEGTVDVMTNEDQRISEISILHGVIDPTDAVTDDRNFKKRVIAKDRTATTPE